MPRFDAERLERFAAALAWEPAADPAPRVLAAGSGWLAEFILDLARKAAVPVRENRDLAERLAVLAPPVTIPEELYLAVAEVYAFLLRLDAKLALQHVGDEIGNAQVDGYPGDVVQR